MSMLSIDRKFALSRNTIKLIAILTMAIDHVACAFETHIPNTAYLVLRFGIGGVAYPLFFVLFLEGTLHTKHPGRQALMLLVTAILSEPFQDMVMFGTWVYPAAQNIMWEWAVTAIMVWLFRHIDGIEKNGPGTKVATALVYATVPIIGWSITIIGGFDYAIIHIPLAVVTYFVLTRMPEQTRTLPIAVVAAIVTCTYLRPGALLAIPIILLYDREKQCKRNKWAGYLAYPAHLCIIAIARCFLRI